VTAADDARRRLERDITSGPRRGLVAISEELDEAHALMDADPEKATALLERLKVRANETLEALRELARGLFPPLLGDKGLVSALGSHVRKHDLPVTLRAEPAVEEMRFGETVETTLYFCCVEALRGADRADVDVFVSNGSVGVAVTGASCGADQTQAIRDRVEAQGGRVDVLDVGIRFSVPAVPPEAAQPELVAQASSSSSGPKPALGM
jgi:signal transduction histidine kinase